MKLALSNLRAVSMFLNLLLMGSPKETLSSRSFRSEQQGRVFGRVMRPLIDKVLWFDKEHCFKCNQRQLARKARITK